MMRGDCNLLLKFVAREKVEKDLPKGWDPRKVVQGVRVEVVQSEASTRDPFLLQKLVGRTKVEKDLTSGCVPQIVGRKRVLKDLSNGWDPEELSLNAEKKRRAARATHELGSFSLEPVEGRGCALVDPDADELTGSGGALVFVRRKKVDKHLANGCDPQKIVQRDRQEVVQDIKSDAMTRGDSNLLYNFVGRNRVLKDLTNCWELQKLCALAEKNRRAARATHELGSFSPEAVQGRGCVLTDPDAVELETALILIDFRRAEEGDLYLGIESEVRVESQLGRKPNYFNKVKTGYKRNKYTGTQFDYDSPGPKPVRGYEFNIFYPDPLETGEFPTVSIYRDESSEATRVIRFHAGPPYADIAFRIVNKDLEFSRRPGVRCTFDDGILEVYFNLKRHGIGCCAQGSRPSSSCDASLSK